MKGKYHKTRHAPEILMQSDLAQVCKATPYCNRLFETIAAKMS